MGISDSNSAVIKRKPGRPKKSEQTTRRANAEVQRSHRDRRNRSVDIMRRVVPGVSEKLDTAGVLENSINYVMYLHKQLDIESISEEFRYMDVSRKLESHRNHNSLTKVSFDC